MTMLTIKQIDAKIRGIAKRSKSLRESVQSVLVQIAAHAYVHGDVTAYDRLFAATSGVNRKAMTRWINKYGFAQLSKDGKFALNKTARKNTDFDDGDQVIEYLTANAPNFWETEESGRQIARELDVAARLKSLTGQIGSALDNGRGVVIDLVAIKSAIADLENTIKIANNT